MQSLVVNQFSCERQGKICKLLLFCIVLGIMPSVVGDVVIKNIGGVIDVITPESIACYGADYPRPYWQEQPTYDTGCLSSLKGGINNVNADICINGSTNVFVNSTFKVGDEKLLYKQQRYYCAHKRIVTNPNWFFSTDLDSSYLNTVYRSVKQP